MPVPLLTLHEQHGVQVTRGCWRERDVLLLTRMAGDADTRARFLQEGAILASLQHPYLPALLQRSPHQLVLAWTDGPTLHDRLRRGPMPFLDVLRVLRGLIGALEALHADGMVHHDLQPAHLQLRLGDPGQLLLSGFGCAWSSQQARDAHDGHRAGTAAWMAPEQFAGVRGDPRSDLYGLGLLLWAMLDPHTPPTADPYDRLLGLAPLRPLPGPAVLHPLLGGCLERDPALRLQNVAAVRELLHDVERWH
ncbi:serine/threonine-protein kinase [Deinococcus sonorensis]|uniref:serine/threonine-protein kinase n=1 Tax=Deinococcus sonorensis TaxID=309891 RepID=UPI0036D41C63